jgi:hypothetical protein
MRDVWALAEVARERLANPSLELMAEVLELLDVQITVLDDTSTLGPARGGANGGVGPATPRLRVEGSVPHAKLLDAVSGEDPSNAKLRPGEPRRR